MLKPSIIYRISILVQRFIPYPNTFKSYYYYRIGMCPENLEAFWSLRIKK